MRRNTLLWITLALVLIGGLNWGLIGLLHFDLVAAVLGKMTFFSRLVYTLVGLAAIVEIVVALTRPASS